MNHVVPTPRDAWCLRFLSSGMRGRRIALKAGANLLGSAPECEVLLPDTDARGQHLSLTAGEVALTVRRLGEAAVELNGAPMSAERRSLVPGDVLRVGAIDMQIDREYAQAPEDAPDSMFLDEDAAAAARAAIRPAPVRWLPRAAAVLLLAVFGLASAGLAWRESSRAPAGGDAPALDIARLRTVLADFPEVVAQPPDAAGQVRLTGFVESAARQHTLSQAVRGLGGRVQLGVTPLDEVVARAREFLADPGVAVSYRGQGHLQLSGATDQAGTRERVQRLTRDLYPMVVVDDSLQYKPVARSAKPANALPDWAERLPARVVSITEGPDGLRFVQLANGDRYFEGAPLRSGGALESVRADDLALPAEPENTNAP